LPIYLAGAKNNLLLLTAANAPIGEINAVAKLAV